MEKINLKEFLQEQKLHSKRETWAIHTSKPVLPNFTNQLSYFQSKTLLNADIPILKHLYTISLIILCPVKRYQKPRTRRQPN